MTGKVAFPTLLVLACEGPAMPGIIITWLHGKSSAEDGSDRASADSL